jgi:hypothetical protein
VYNYDNNGPQATYHFSKTISETEARNLGFNQFIRARNNSIAARTRAAIRGGNGTNGLVGGAFATMGISIADLIANHYWPEPTTHIEQKK